MPILLGSAGRQCEDLSRLSQSSWEKVSRECSGAPRVFREKLSKSDDVPGESFGFGETLMVKSKALQAAERSYAGLPVRCVLPKTMHYAHECLACPAPETLKH